MTFLKINIRYTDKIKLFMYKIDKFEWFLRDWKRVEEKSFMNTFFLKNLWRTTRVALSEKGLIQQFW